MTREDQLMQKIQQGDTEAVEEPIRIYYPEILRYCLWHAPSPSLAEDGAQETFLKAFRYFDRYTHRGKFRPFLYRIAANTCVDLWRREGEGGVSLEELTEEPVCEDRALETAELRLMVRNLPEELREIVLLRFAQNLTLREIGDALGLPLRTVQSRLRSALKKLKQEFEEGGQL